MICPLFFAALLVEQDGDVCQPAQECRGPRCAWWVTEGRESLVQFATGGTVTTGHCAVQDIARLGRGK